MFLWLGRPLFILNHQKINKSRKNKILCHILFEWLFVFFFIYYFCRVCVLLSYINWMIYYKNVLEGVNNVSFSRKFVLDFILQELYCYRYVCDRFKWRAFWNRIFFQNFDTLFFNARHNEIIGKIYGHITFQYECIIWL